MRCIFCKGNARKAMVTHKVGELTFEAEAYKCQNPRCKGEFETPEQAVMVEKKLEELKKSKE